MEEPKDKQEIDLIHIFSVIWKQLKNLCSAVYHVLVWCLRFAYKQRVYLLGALCCAIAFTLFWARPANRKYQMESEIRISALDAYYFKDVVANLDYMCRSLDVSGIAKALEVPHDVAEKVEAVQSFYIIDKLIDGTPDEVCYGEYVADTTSLIMKDRLVLRILLADSMLVPTVSKALLRYFENSDYVKNINSQRLTQIDARISNIDKEIVMLDSLRKTEYFNKRPKDLELKGPLVLTEKSQQLYYNDILSLLKLRDENMLQKAVYSEPVKYVRPFVLVKEKNKYFRTFAGSFLFFVVVSLIIAAFVHNRKEIKSFLEK